MPSYKRLKSLAHNVAHSFLSNMNYVDGDYVGEDLFQRARKAGASRVRIDFLTGTVEPSAVRTPRVVDSVARTRDWLPRQAASEGCDFRAIQSFVLQIDFRFDQTRESKNVPGLELPAYDAHAVIVDDRGRNHDAKVPEWWRYG